MRLTSSILLIISYFFISSTSALELETKFIKNTAMVYLRGELLPGDEMRFAKEVVRINEATSHILVHINSPGGSLVTAENLGRMIRDLGYTVFIEENGACASACFVVYALAISRSALSGELAVHRPYFDRKFYKEISLNDALEKHRLAVEKFKEILARSGIPRDIVDMAVSRSSDDVYVLSKDELARIGTSPPWIEELLISRCGYKAAQVREATFGSSFSHEERIRWMDHRADADLCLREIYRDNNRAALRRLRSAVGNGR